MSTMKQRVEELGGAAVHVRISGTIDDAAPDESSAIAMARRYLSYLPTNAWSYPPLREAVEPPADSEQNVLDLLPPSNRSAYDMHGVINCVVDSDSWFPIKPDYEKAMITSFARLHEEIAGIFANQPVFAPVRSMLWRRTRRESLSIFVVPTICPSYRWLTRRAS
jgi:acetyl-CoA carboxylase carboxyltransferase component